MRLATEHGSLGYIVLQIKCGEGGGRGESRWGIHVNPWLIHVDVRQKPLQYCKVISLQLIKINEKNKNKLIHKISYCLIDPVVHRNL